MARKWPISRDEYNELDKLAKKANQRLTSMKEGQRQAVEYYTKGKKFSRAVPKSRAEYNQRMRDVERFLSAEQTTRRGWERIKKKAVKSAGKTLRSERKYKLTDDELANIFKEVDKKSQRQLYKILDIVQAKKYDADAKGRTFNNDALQKAINQAVKSHKSAKEALERRNNAKKRKEKSAKKRKERSAKDLRK